MALTSQTIGNAVRGQFSAVGFTGRNVSNLSNAVGLATYMFITTPNIVTCSLNGTAGPVGNLMLMLVAGLNPPSMSNYMGNYAKIKRLTGRDISKLFTAASIGLVTQLYTMTLTGMSAGLAVGVGTGRFATASTKIMSNILASTEIQNMLQGRNNRDLADCIAFGMVQHLKTEVTLTISATGAIAPVAPAGPVAVAMIPSVFNKIS